MTTKQRVQRILSNLTYLLARYLARVTGKNEFIQQLIEKFLDGWNDGYEAVWMRLEEREIILAD